MRSFVSATPGTGKEKKQQVFVYNSHWDDVEEKERI
jgi:hypothetical protein